MLESLIFSNRRTYVWARHLLFWVVWSLFFAYIYAPKYEPLGPAWAYGLSLAEALVYLPIHIALSYALIYWIIPEYLLKSRYVLALLATALALVLAALASHLTAVWVISPLRDLWRDAFWPGMQMPHVMRSTMQGLMAGLRGSNTVAGFAGTIKLLKYWYQKNSENKLLREENLTAELHLLKAQLHPHFLFNTLNNLYGHIITESRDSGDIVLKLSDMLHYMLYECKAEKVPLAGEVRMLRNYMALEKLRYGDSLELSFREEGITPDQQIVPLLLLPFVENAFKHGASQELEKAWVSVSLTVRNDELSAKVINPMPEGGEPPRRGEGIGLSNVRKRLNLLYPNDSHKLTITRTEELFVVSLKVKLQTAPRPRMAEIM